MYSNSPDAPCVAPICTIELLSLPREGLAPSLESESMLSQCSGGYFTVDSYIASISDFCARWYHSFIEPIDDYRVG